MARERRMLYWPMSRGRRQQIADDHRRLINRDKCPDSRQLNLREGDRRDKQCDRGHDHTECEPPLAALRGQRREKYPCIVRHRFQADPRANVDRARPHARRFLLWNHIAIVERRSTKESPAPGECRLHWGHAAAAASTICRAGHAFRLPFPPVRRGSQQERRQCSGRRSAQCHGLPRRRTLERLRRGFAEAQLVVAGKAAEMREPPVHRNGRNVAL